MGITKHAAIYESGLCGIIFLNLLEKNQLKKCLKNSTFMLLVFNRLCSTMLVTFFYFDNSSSQSHHSFLLQPITESIVSENAWNFDCTDGFLRQKDEQVETGQPCAEANEWYPVQMAAKQCASDENLLQEIHSPVTQRIETRAVRKSRFHPGMLKREEECAASQICYSFELQEEVKKLKEQLRESKAEIQQMKAELGRYLFLEDKEKRSGKLKLLLRAPTSDESRQYAANSSCNETSLHTRRLVEKACSKKQPGMCMMLIVYYTLMQLSKT